MHHDQIFGDFAGDGINQLAFWVQRSKVLYLATPPRDPKQFWPWPLVPIARVGSAEGLAKAHSLEEWVCEAGPKYFEFVPFLDFTGRQPELGAQRSQRRPCARAPHGRRRHPSAR